MDSEQKALNLIGLATKAGKTKSGEFSTEQSVKKGRACLVVVSKEASENTKKMFRDKCAFYETAIVFFGDKESLGHSIGRRFRASLAVVDEGLAQALQKKLALKNN